jgi:dihydrofolate reductase
MENERKIIVYIATSADGYIARSDGSVDWLKLPQTADDYGYAEFYNSVDTVLWGRITYEPVLQKFLSKKRKVVTATKAKKKTRTRKFQNYVFTHNPPKLSPPDVEFVNEPIGQFAKRLRATPGKNIWMMGGGGIIASFLDEDQIDEFMIHVIPVFIGDGIPLIQPRHRTVELDLLATKSWPDGVVRLHYAVKRAPSRQAKQQARRSSRGRLSKR